MIPINTVNTVFADKPKREFEILFIFLPEKPRFIFAVNDEIIINGKTDGTRTDTQKYIPSFIPPETSFEKNTAAAPKSTIKISLKAAGLLSVILYIIFTHR